MNRIESNIKINGRHWGLDFTAGVAYTGNAALAAKLRLKGYTVTNGQPEQPEADLSNTKWVASDVLPTNEHEKSTATETQPEATPITNTAAEAVKDEPTETVKPKATKSRKRAVKADAADAD